MAVFDSVFNSETVDISFTKIHGGILEKINIIDLTDKLNFCGVDRFEE